MYFNNLAVQQWRSVTSETGHVLGMPQLVKIGTWHVRNWIFYEYLMGKIWNILWVD